MQRLIAIAFILIVTLPVMHKAIVITNYIVDYDYISQVLCINKEEPELQCNGKCHLNKELNKAESSEDNDSKNNSRTNLEIGITYFLNAQEEILIPQLLSLKKKTFFYTNFFTTPFINSFDKPPRA